METATHTELLDVIIDKNLWIGCRVQLCDGTIGTVTAITEDWWVEVTQGKTRHEWQPSQLRKL